MIVHKKNVTLAKGNGLNLANSEGGK